MWVVYCYTKIYPKCKRLKTIHTHSLFPSFSGLGIWVKLSWVLYLKDSHKTATKILTEALVSSQGSTGEGSIPNSLMEFLGGYSSLRLLDLGPQFLTSCWPEDALSSLPHGLLHRPAHNMEAGWLHQSEQVKESKRYGVCKHNRSHSVLWLNLRVTFLFLLVFCWLEADTRSSPQTKGVEHTREGDSTRVWIPESRYHWRGWGKSYKATYHNCPVLGM